MGPQSQQIWIFAGIAFLVVVIAGAVLAVANPHAEPFDRYITHVSIVGGALGIGAGISSRSGGGEN